MKQSELGNILVRHGLKVTPKRMFVLKSFTSSKIPLTAQEVAKSIKSDSQIDQVTVYRNIERLTVSGILKELSLQKGVTHYEYAIAHSHHHVVCTSCGTMEDFEMCQAKKISTQVLKTSVKFKEIKRHSFELFGVCNSCSR